MGALGGRMAARAQSPAAGTAASGSGSPAAGAPVAAEYKTVPQVFGPDFNFDFLISLGFTCERGAGIGECFAVASQIEDGNYESWVAAWLAMGDCLNGIGQTAETAGHNVSASEAFLRASTLSPWFQPWILGGQLEPKAEALG